jgi:hypothetical protein
MTKPIDLSSLDNAYAQAPVPGPAPLPDGPYLVEIQSVELRATRHSQRPMLCWTLRVLAPTPFLGRRLWRNQVLAQSNLGWLKKDLRLCGIELDKLSDLPRHLEHLRALRLEIVKHTRDDFQSISFRRRA